MLNEAIYLQVVERERIKLYSVERLLFSKQ